MTPSLPLGRIESIAFAFNPIWPIISWAGTLVWNRLGAIRTCCFVQYSYQFASSGRYASDSSFTRKAFSSWAAVEPGLVVSRSDQYLNLVFLIGFPLSLWLIGVWKLVCMAYPADRSTLSATNDHRSDFGIAHVYYIGLEKPVLDTYKANSLLFGNAAGFHSVLTLLEFTGISVLKLFSEPV